ncbi:hypothetical protein F5Y10DRAFT_251107 [Nemania abortiva]|nr:hypothetical protein F5Y10DRAFT_251107 [Nemania abortiva]
MMSCEAPTSGDQAKATADSETLERARLRRNQRNSRARKQAYIRDLESRWNECLRLGAQATVEMQSEARRVQEENRLLRSILHAQGFDDAAIQNALRSAKQSTAANRVSGAQTCGPSQPATSTSEAPACAPSSGAPTTAAPTTADSDLTQSLDLHNWLNDLSDIKDAFGAVHAPIDDRYLLDNPNYMDSPLDGLLSVVGNTGNAYLSPGHGVVPLSLQASPVDHRYAATTPQGPQTHAIYMYPTNL